MSPSTELRMRLDVSVNPLRVGLPRETVVDPCIFVIFGKTGGLAQRKLLPALYVQHVLPPKLGCYDPMRLSDQVR